MTGGSNWSDLYYAAHDGLRLYARHYPASGPGGRARGASPRPLLCLSSLIGNADEFHVLASYLASHPETPRDVYCLDYRGRGRSQVDRNPLNYTPFIELRDILDFLAASGLPRCDVLGSSRGGINLMLLATVRPAALGSLILNDLGPVLEPQGVARVISYLASLTPPPDWPAARGLMREMYGHAFPALAEADFDALARRWFREPQVAERNGRLAFSYDRRIVYANKQLDLRRAIPDMWGQYLALLRRPLLIIRGENSDLLSRKTLEHMRSVHWRAQAVTVPGQGHAPLLRDAASLNTIQQFLAEQD